MISLNQTVFLNSNNVSIELSFLSVIPIILILFSVVGTPRAKYDAESNRQLLLRLLRVRPLTQKELIEVSNLSKSNVNYAINTLIKLGRVKKVKNIRLDMRSVVYRINDEFDN